MRGFSSIRGRLAKLAAMSVTAKPIAFVFSNADGTMNPFNSAKLRQARQAGAHVVEFHFLRPPSEGFSP
jgi:hypothetical protein